MGNWPGRAALGATLGAVLLVGIPSPAVASGGRDEPSARDVMLDDIGPSWQIVSEQPGTLGAFTRTFGGDDGELSIVGFPVTTPPGVGALFDAFIASGAGLDAESEPSFELAAWLVLPGGAPGDAGASGLVVGSRDYFFVINVEIAAGSRVDGRQLVLDVAHRQEAAAGGPPSGAPPLPKREVDDSELLPWLPTQPPAGYGLGAQSITVNGPGEEEVALADDDEIFDFLSRRSKDVTRVWGGLGLTVGVGITQYPYDVFAGAALDVYAKHEDEPIAGGAIAGLPHAVAFRQPEQSQVGIVFRRGDVLVTVLAMYEAPETEAAAIALATDMAATVAERVPGGATARVDLSPPSRFVGLGLTVAFVTAGVAGSRAIALLRARRVRRRWSADEPPLQLPAPGSPVPRIVDLDADAAALRRRGWTLAAIQLTTVTVGVVAVAGDFATIGLVVAGASLLLGLAVSRWWMGRELTLLGPSAPQHAFVLPRLPGVVLGLGSFAVLGIGVAYLLKGVRYLALPMTLAQLQWSDRLDISPRAVGVAFAAGGLVAAAVGAAMYRGARAMGRAGTRRVLAADPRPPALYLRSFADDSLRLPAIASARRPLFELFSIRGADPFEEPVAWELNTYAPVVAVGRPGGTLQTLGAAREHLAQETWRDEIAERMTGAGLIVLAPGETDGLEWELGEIVRGGHLVKSLFVFPPLPPADLQRRWLHTAQLLRQAGAAVAGLAVPAARVHTLRIEQDGALFVTVASTRDEATYRTAVDRSVAVDVIQAVPAMAAPAVAS